MPNIWTHLIFGEELVGQAGLSGMLGDSNLQRVFRMGCQGPDFLFYHRFLPWQKGKGLPALGSAMHAEACGPYVLELLQQLQGRPLYNPAVVFALGFITHHILDRNMHPYIFYKSGFKKWNHQRFEIAVDTLVVRARLGLETWKTPVWKLLDAGPALPLGLAAAMNTAAHKLYPQLAAGLTEADWNEAYRDMLRAQRLFHDPHGVKRALTFGYIAPLVYTRKLPGLDYLNESRSVWNCPTSQDEVYDSSIWDLWDRALADGRTVLEQAVRALQSGKPVADTDYEPFMQALGNRSYETGKPCESGARIVYVNPIL
ncbi:zinc dependent phospholipase C family protein [Paenibacillus athensensis]|uniref:Phospholipase C/D domain-containing protein n=1 Tax=Paenibacillus athensensis TaxID=1967502 RepID=A0A4Y8QAJ7_9BACL|nr:zinc dependent phospholipase C family protein [Paenibacillus athensensis]MCD1257538.1 zinc dependent phospholipase C family protein [Paenibacillus athensensis]